MAVLVCSGPSTVAQRVRALRLGADDWLGKPCHADELLARVEAVVRRRRRQEAPEAGEPVMAGDLEIRADKFQVLAGSVAVDLTQREFELIGALVEAQGQVLRREEIYERVWGYAMVHGDRPRRTRAGVKRPAPPPDQLDRRFCPTARISCGRSWIDGSLIVSTWTPCAAARRLAL